MEDTLFNPWDLLVYFKKRWTAVASSCAIALALTFAVSVSTPKRYTARAELLIQAPGGNDPRAATAISAAYLESLKAYERLASSDTLFARALAHVQAPDGGATRSIESLKRKILRVSKPANTAVLEISATMTDPKKAQALAQYVAEQTVTQSVAMDAQSESDMTGELRGQLQAAAQRLAKIRGERQSLKGGEPVDGLQDQLENNDSLKLNIEKELSETEAELAGYLSEQQAIAAGNADKEMTVRLAASAKARTSALENQLRDLNAVIEKQGTHLQEWKDHREALLAEEKSAQASFDSANVRYNEAVSSGQFRGERLRMIDPGIIPQEPSSPNVLLNMLAALVLSAGGSIFYLTLTYSYTRARRLQPVSMPEPAFSYRR